MSAPIHQSPLFVKPIPHKPRFKWSTENTPPTKTRTSTTAGLRLPQQSTKP
ncbi:hypothetical protein RHGRI_003351 [Rhododendron griersonianum]|uniref:Uncharacterized protein n=1 Tax=Rhododendron griersonianum TaxID=479676 RepID=A0AAV6L7X2_9ERIC|nr:hypothetical protein RHGRI_003351 [Rhododendron griersonianum]